MNIFTSFKKFILIGLAVFSLPILADSVKAVATVSKNVVTPNELFQLTISVNDSLQQSALDLSPLDGSFFYGAPSLSNSTSFINGARSSETRWRVTLRAVNTGTFTIPSLNIDGLTTAPIEIQVVPSSAQASDSQNEQSVQLVATIGNQNPYINERFIYELELKIGARINSGDLSPPQGAGLQVTQYGEDIRSERVENGRRYLVINRQYEIVPTQAGNLTLTGAKFTGYELKGNDYNAVSIPIERQSQHIELAVKDKPTEIDGIWLPTKDLQIFEQWQPSLTDKTVKVGESINRVIELRIKNISQSSMPNLTLTYPDSLRVYEGKPTYHSENDYSVMQINQVLIPREAGTIELAPISINWFNTQTGQPQTSTLDAVSFSVLPSDQISSPAPLLPTQVQENIASIERIVEKEAGFWPWLSAFFALLWLITLGFFWHKQKLLATKKIVIDKQNPLKPLKEAIKANKIADIAKYYQAYDFTYLPQSLSNELSAEIDLMLASVYSATPTTWNNSKLLTLIEQAQKHKFEKITTSPLAEL